MATKPTRPAPPPPVPKHTIKLPVLHALQRDSNNNKHEGSSDLPPSRPTVIRPKMVQTPKKKPPPRPPPPKTGSYISQRSNSRQAGSTISNATTAADLDSVFGPPKVDCSTSTNEDHSKSTGKLISFSRGQFSLFGSSSKHQRAPLRKGPAPKRPHTPATSAGSNKGSAPPPPVPPHRNGTTGGHNSDGTASLISFDSPPPSPAGSRASWSSGVSSQSSQTGGTQPCLLDLDVPPLQDQPWGTTLPHSQTSDWGSGPARDSGAGDSARPSEDPWSFPRSGSVPSLPTAGDDSSPSPSWNFPDSHSSPDSGTWDSPRESWSPPPPLHPPPAPPSVDDGDVEPSPLAVAICNYQAAAPGELSFKVQDLIVLLSEDSPTTFRGRCGDEEGLVPKRCVDVVHPLNGGRHLQTVKDASRNTPEGDGSERYCTALYDFVGEGPQELSLRKGDVVRVLGSLNGSWMLGTLHGQRGMFPANFVEVSSGPRTTNEEAEGERRSKGCPVIALHTFQAEQEGDLGFNEGDTVTVLSRINKDWLYGELDGRRGQFPAGFVQPISGSGSQKSAVCNLYKAVYAFNAQHHDELSLKVADIVDVTQKINDDWWQGRLLGNTSTREGIFPASFVQKLN